jgi:hypothetical protein
MLALQIYHPSPVSNQDPAVHKTALSTAVSITYGQFVVLGEGAVHPVPLGRQTVNDRYTFALLLQHRDPALLWRMSSYLGISGQCGLRADLGRQGSAHLESGSQPEPRFAQRRGHGVAVARQTGRQAKPGGTVATFY